MNNNSVSETNLQKQLGIVFDKRLSFEEHLKMIVDNVNKTRGLLSKLHTILPRSARLTIYKDFVRPHLAYANIIYDQAYNATFHQKLELIQYNPCLALTLAIRGTSKEKFYEELGLESLRHCRLYGKLSYFL